MFLHHFNSSKLSIYFQLYVIRLPNIYPKSGQNNMLKLLKHPS